MKRLIFLITFLLLSQTGFAQVQRTISIDEQTYQSLTENFCAAKGWTSQVTGEGGEMIDNPVNCPQFIQKSLIDYTWAVVSNYRAGQASEDARKESVEQIETAKENASITVS